LKKWLKKKIVTIEENSPGVLKITAIHKDNLEYKSFIAVKDDTEDDLENEKDEALVQEFYKPSKALTIIFASCAKEYFTKKELPEILRKYILDHKLEGPAKHQVTLDGLLSEAIFQKQIKLGEIVDKKC